KAQRLARRWDRELGKIPLCRTLEQTTHVPKVSIAVAMASSMFMLLFFNIAGRLITNLLAWIYPAYASLQSIESSDISKRQQWIPYWVILGLFHSIEYFEDTLVYWLPFYFLFKAVFLLYLMLPPFNGATLVYARLIRPNL
ncbi:hypothetical protein DM01DRAFT_1273004, partial [Hesseltinella vesiculosa]